MFRKAERSQVKLKLAITGPSGAGKTYSALKIAKGLGSRIAVIDTENDSASLYADIPGMPEFDVITINDSFETKKYLQLIDSAVKEKYDVLIIDSISHQWNAEGGIMNRKQKEELAKPGTNGYTLFAKYTPEHESFKQKIIQSPIHIIATMRSKTDYVIEQNERGKMAPRKVGLAPVQRDGIEYEFSVVFDLNNEHFATVSKDRTGLFDGKNFILDEKVGEEMIEWLKQGKKYVDPNCTREELESLFAVIKAKGIGALDFANVLKEKFDLNSRMEIKRVHYEELLRMYQTPEKDDLNPGNFIDFVG